MPEHKYEIDLPGNGVQFKPFKATLNRVNVVLGGNGTGKSKLLEYIKSSRAVFGEINAIIFIEGGRTVEIPNSLQLTNADFNQYRTYDQTEKHYFSKRQSSLSKRIKDALILLEQTEQELNNKYAQEAEAWRISGREQDLPPKPTAPLKRLFELFSEVFPTIELEFISANKTLSCCKNGQEQKYSPNGLSDGEKQIFCLLADLVVLANGKNLILVDEPELNLHPGLACRFWDIVEAELPESVFIYATHCISFALRNSVENIIVLGQEPESNTIIGNISELDQSELNELLGAIPAILSSNKALAVEGNEASFDQLFFRWIIDDNDVEIIPVGDCAEVSAVANKKGIWNKIAPSVGIAGVIDSDYRSEEKKATFSIGSAISLSYHEAESYLCEPKLLAKLGSELSLIDSLPTEEEIAEFIKSEFKSQLHGIAARRTFSRGEIRLAVSLKKKVLSEAATPEELKELLKAEAAKEQEKAVEAIGPDKMIEIFENELKTCQEALDLGDIDKILTLIPGKELLRKLAPKIGCKLPINVMNATKKHLDISEFEALGKLKAELIEKF